MAEAEQRLATHWPAAATPRPDAQRGAARAHPRRFGGACFVVSRSLKEEVEVVIQGFIFYLSYARLGQRIFHAKTDSERAQGTEGFTEPHDTGRLHFCVHAANGICGS